MTPSLYKALLGPRYQVLPRSVQELHDCGDRATYTGLCRVQRGRGWLVNLLADILSLPKAALQTPVNVTFTANGAREIWDRRFGSRPFRSVQWQKDGLLHERLKMTTLVFRVDADESMLNLVLLQVRILGLPVTRLLRPQVIARETERNGKFHFFIRTSLPMLGLLVQYEGDLERASCLI